MIEAKRKKVGHKKTVLLGALFGGFLLVGVLMIVLFKYLQEYGLFFSVFFFASSVILLVTLIDFLSKRKKNNESEQEYCLRYQEGTEIIFVSDLNNKVSQIPFERYRSIKKNDDELLLVYADEEGLYHEIHLGFSDDITNVKDELDKLRK